MWTSSYSSTWRRWVKVTEGGGEGRQRKWCLEPRGLGKAVAVGQEGHLRGRDPEVEDSQRECVPAAKWGWHTGRVMTVLELSTLGAIRLPRRATERGFSCLPSDLRWLLLCVLVAQFYPTLGNSWTVARQAPLSMGFSRQEYFSRLPFPSPWLLCPPKSLPSPRRPLEQLASFVRGEITGRNSSHKDRLIRFILGDFWMACVHFCESAVDGISVKQEMARKPKCQ